MNTMKIVNDYVEVEIQYISKQWHGNEPTKANPNPVLWLELDKENYDKVVLAYKDTFNGQRLDGCHTDNQLGYQLLGVFYNDVGYATVQEALEEDDRVKARYILKIM